MQYPTVHELTHEVMAQIKISGTVPSAVTLRACNFSLLCFFNDEQLALFESISACHRR